MTPTGYGFEVREKAIPSPIHAPAGYCLRRMPQSMRRPVRKFMGRLG